MPSDADQVIVAVGSLSPAGTFSPDSVASWRVIDGPEQTLLSVTTLMRRVGPEYDGHAFYELDPHAPLDQVIADLRQSPSLIVRRLFTPDAKSFRRDT